MNNSGMTNFANIKQTSLKVLIQRSPGIRIEKTYSGLDVLMALLRFMDDFELRSDDRISFELITEGEICETHKTSA
jgi:hypothetical protein